MKVAYVISGYKKPHQLKRLVSVLSEDWSRCYVHIDAKADIAPFRAAVDDVQGVEFVRDRVRVTWGTFTFVKSILNTFSQIRGSDFRADYIALLSIQDYPIKSNEHIRQHLIAHNGCQHMSCKALPDPDLVDNGGMDRINRFYFGDFRDRGRIGRLARAFYHLYAPRVLPDGLTPHVGHCVCLTADCVDHILELAAHNAKAMRFFRYTFATDEVFFPSVIMSSPFATNIHSSATYVDWGERLPHPRILGPEDLPKLRESDRLFARKFDIDEHPEFLDVIDRELLGRP